MVKKKDKRGFTLIELMVVMMIIAVLSGLALVSLQSSRRGARDAQRRADLEEIRAALEMYKVDLGTYPTTAMLVGPGTPWTIAGGGVTYYISEGDPTEFGYRYVPTVVGTVAAAYNLCAHLETDTGDTYETQCGSCNGAVCNYMVTQP